MISELFITLGTFDQPPVTLVGDMEKISINFSREIWKYCKQVASNKEKYLLMQIINTWTFTPLNLADRILVWCHILKY